MLYMFRTVLVHHQEQLCKLYIAFGVCRHHTSGCWFIYILTDSASTYIRPHKNYCVHSRIYFKMFGLDLTENRIFPLQNAVGECFVSKYVRGPREKHRCGACDVSRHIVAIRTCFICLEPSFLNVQIDAAYNYHSELIP